MVTRILRSRSTVPTNTWPWPPRRISIPGDVLSLEIWAKRTATGNYDYIWWGGVGDYILFVDNTDHLTFAKANVATIFSVTGTWTDGDWHHVVVTKNGSTFHLYVDGVEPAGTFTNATLVASTSRHRDRGVPR